jgi:hypothetical protein
VTCVLCGRPVKVDFDVSPASCQLNVLQLLQQQQQPPLGRFESLLFLLRDPSITAGGMSKFPTMTTILTTTTYWLILS